MDKRKHVFRNIAWIAALILIIGLSSALLLRNTILTSILPSLISTQTSEHIELRLDRAYLGWDGEVFLLNPSLSFDSVFLDNARSMELKRLSFDTIRLYGASLRSIMSQGIIQADSLKVSRPDIEIREHQVLVQDPDFNPDHLLALLGSKSIADSAVKIKLGNIQIDYGKLDLEGLSSGTDSINDIDFSMHIENFSTLLSENSDNTRILFSDDIILELSNIDKLPLSGYDLDIGSLLFSIKKNKLRINGIKLFPQILSDSIDQVALAADRIEFDGLNINEIRGKDEIKLRSARIYNGYFTTNTNRIEKSGREAHNDFFTRFADRLSHFHLDTLGIHNFDIEFMVYLKDSLIWIADLDMELFGVEIDSSMMDDLYREIVFDEFVVNTGPIGFNKPQQGLSILTERFYHNSARHEKTAFYNIRFQSVNPVNGKDNINLTASEIAIYGITEEPVYYPDRMDISVYISDLHGNINNFNDQQDKDPKNRIDIFEYINLDTLRLNNTKLRLAGNNISAARLSLINDEFQARDISFSTPLSKGDNKSSMGLLEIDEFSLEKILAGSSLDLGKIRMDHVRSGGSFIISGSDNNPANPLKLPFDHIILEGVELNNCSLNTNFNIRGSTYSIATNVNFSLGPIDIKGPYLELNELSGMDATFRFTNTSAEILYHKLNSKETSIDLQKGLFILNDLKVHPLGVSDHPGFVINELHIPNFEIRGLNYIDIIEHDGFDHDLLDFEQLSFDDIRLNFTIDPDSSSKSLSVDKISLGYSYPATKHDNFMDKIHFSFNNISFKEAQSHTQFSIGSGNYNNSGNSLLLNNIHGGNMLADDKDDLQKNDWEYSSDELIIKGLYVANTMPARLNMDALILSNADIMFSSDQNSGGKTNFELELDGYRKFGNTMSRLSVDTTILNEVKITYNTVTDSTSHTFLADSIRLVVHDIKIDTNIFNNPEQDIIQKMSIDLKGRTRVTADSLYLIRSGRINYDFSQNIISIDSFEVIPRYEEAEFFKRAIYQTDRMSLFSQCIEAHDFRLEELITDKHIHFGEIDVNGLDLEMLRDKTYDRKKDDFKPMPQEMLRNTRQKFTFDTINIHEAYVRYGEYVEKSAVPGIIFFDKFNLNMYGISSDLPKADPTASIKVNLDARIMGQAGLKADLVFPYLGDSSDFWMHASSELIDLTILNPLTENLLGLSIKEGKGRIENSFITGNSTHSKGSMLFTYKGLKLNLYNRKKAEQNKGLFGGITRFLINDIIIHKNNPKFAKEPRSGQVYFERDQEKAILNYMWKSLLSGMLSSIGINNKEQRQEKKEMKKINNFR